MEERDYQDDPVRLATIKCPHRKGQIRTFWGGRRAMDYDCVHPAAMKEHEEIQELPGGGIMAGGIDGFATFCEPVDTHLTSLGEKSRFILEGEYRVIENVKLARAGERKSLPPGDKKT